MNLEKQSYYDLVYYVTQKIPPGRVTNYGAIAEFLSLGSPRMVGWALAKCKGGIPAHRVVNSKGELSAQALFQPPGRMQQLLEEEGVVIKNNKVASFKSVFWHPQEIEEQ